jgi:hypothetical protein
MTESHFYEEEESLVFGYLKFLCGKGDKIPYKKKVTKRQFPTPKKKRAEGKSR